MSDIKETDFYDYLRSQFTDLEGAKLFMWKWANEMDEEIPEFGPISSRALAAYCSAVLEGCLVNSNGGLTNYLDSKYGSDLYFAAWGQRPNVVSNEGVS